MMTRVIPRQAVLGDIIFDKGTGAHERNLQRVLDALEEIADEKQEVHRRAFESFLRKRPRIFFEELAERGCIELTFDGASRGRPLQKITLRTRIVPADESAVPESPRRIAPAPKIVPAVPAKAPGHVLIPSPRCLLFIDAPNLYNVGKRLMGKNCPEESEFLNFKRTKWEEFREIGVEITGISRGYQTNCLYTIVPHGRHDHFDEKCAEIKEVGIRVKTRERKDIDLFLATDLLREAFSYITNKRKIHIVLVSGDSDYTYTLRCVRELAKEAGADVEISVIAWSGGMSVELKETADRTYLVETYLNRLDPVGAQNWLREYKRKRA